MKEILYKKAKAGSNPSRRLHLLREGLQQLVLKILDAEGCFKYLSFLGGTALRIIYDLRRYSEDLDFSLIADGHKSFHWDRLLKQILTSLEVYGFRVDIKQKNEGAVKNVFLRFNDVLQEAGVSQRKGQKLAVKLEVDTNPPDHAILIPHLISKDFVFSVVHHDLSTLYTGKILAFLFRPYTKGRDIYDLIWFSGKGEKVNRPYLESGSLQSLGRQESWTADELKEKLETRMKEVSLQKARDDVYPFLEDPEEIRFFERELLASLFRRIEYQNE